MAANMLPIIMMSSMASSCSSSVSSPLLMWIFLGNKLLGFIKGLNPFKGIANVGKGIGKGVKKGAQAIDRGGRKAVKAIGKSAKKTGKALKKAFKVKKIRFCFSPETPIKLENW